MAKIVKSKKDKTKPKPPPASPPPPVTSPVVTSRSAYRDLGNTDRESFRKAMSRVFVDSRLDEVPFAKQIDAMYDALVPYGMTRLAPPMSWHECKNSTFPTCGVPTWCKNPWSVTGAGDAGSSGRWAAYSSYPVAAAEWGDLVKNGSPYATAKSIRDFIMIYAPPWDNNDVDQYVQVIVDGVNALPIAGSIDAPVGDVFDLLYGGKPYTISAYYGQLVTWSCPGCYDYFPAYGLDSKHHWAYDLSADAGDGAPLFAPFDGTIVCAGTDIGGGAWGTGCAAFDRVNNYGGAAEGTGNGRIELLNATGDASLIIGHALSCAVRLGDRVTRGQLIGRQGGMNGTHVHAEGRYDNGTRIGDPRVMFGGGPIVVDPDPQPISPPDDAPPYVVVRAIRTTRVLQRGNPSSPSLLPDLQRGTKFHAQHKVIGYDGQWYWVGRFLGRVLEADTEVVEVVV